MVLSPGSMPVVPSTLGVAEQDTIATTGLRDFSVDPSETHYREGPFYSASPWKAAHSRQRAKGKGQKANDNLKNKVSLIRAL